MNNRTWAEINLDALAHNMREIRRITNPNSRIMAVVKADAYGHGAVVCAKTLLENGADCLAVATLNEAEELRRFYDVPIFILGAGMESEAEGIVKNSITPGVFTYEFAQALSAAAVKLKKTADIFIKLDTGMSRIGIVATDGDNSRAADEIARIAMLPNINIAGMLAHFAVADEADGSSYTRTQYERFMDVCGLLKERGVEIPVKCVCNSAGIMMYPEYHMDMVRPGIILYGMYPSDEVDRSVLDLKYVMSLKSLITYVKEIEPGRGVGYGREYIADQTAKIATVPIGYADGYPRLLKNKAEIAVNGKRFPVAGRICMDQCMIDVTSGNNINRGDEALIFGNGAVTVDDIAAWLGTINYEVTCLVSRRIPRVYMRDGKAVKTVDYLL